MRKIYTSIIIFILLLGLSPGLAYAKDYSMTIDYLIKLGKNHYNKGNYTDSVTEFKKCLLTEPNCTTCQEYLIASENILEKKQQMIKAAFKEIGKTKEKSVKKSESIKPIEQKLKSETPKSIEQKPQPAKIEQVPQQKSDTIKTEKQTAKEGVPEIQRGAWTVPKGRLYVESYTKYYWDKSEFDDKGKKREWSSNGKYDEITTEIKLEYGVTDDLTYLLYIPYKIAHWRDDNAKSTRRGLVDVWTGLKYRLFSDPFIFSLQARVKIPGNYNPNDSPSLGSRQVDGELKMLLGKSLWPFHGYTKAELGFRLRNEEPTNEILYFYELGYYLTDNLILKAGIDGVEGISGTGKIDEDYTKLFGGTIFRLRKSINIEIDYGHTIAGKNTGAAQEVVLSVGKQF